MEKCTLLIGYDTFVDSCNISNVLYAYIKYPI